MEMHFPDALELVKLACTPLGQGFLNQLGRSAAEKLQAQLKQYINSLPAKENSVPLLPSDESVEMTEVQQLDIAAQLLPVLQSNSEITSQIKDTAKQLKALLNDQSRQDFNNVSITDLKNSQALQILGNNAPVNLNMYSAGMPEEHTLSDSAKELLESAKQGGDITFCYLQTGPYIETSNRPFITDSKPETAARWKSALKELADYGYVDRPTGGEQGIYHLTSKAYDN